MLLLSKHGWERGFTVIELVTTIAIIGILSAVVAPRFFDNTTLSERGYTDEIASTLRYGQRIAIASGCPVRVQINAANYSAMQRTAAGNACSAAGAWATQVRRTDGTNVTGNPPQGVVLAPAATTVTFLADGTVSNGAALTIGGFFQVNVDPVNGAVTVLP